MGKDTVTKPIVGVDLGGTKILAGVVEESGKILGIAKNPTKAQAGPEEVIERIAKTVLEAIKSAGLDKSRLGGVCVGAPGPLDPVRGVVVNTPNLPGWNNVPLADLLRDRLGLPVIIDNDVNLGTYGEYALGAGQGYKDLIGIFVGTGIGGGLILNGELREGARYTAAEIGHMILLADGPVCGCGSRGCAEALASRTAIERDILAGIKAGRESLISEITKRSSQERLTSGALAEAYRKGDPLVAEVIGRAQFYLGLLAASAANLIDPEAIIFGGGVVEALGEECLEPIRRVAYQYIMNRPSARQIRILRAKLGDNAALLGAAAFARRKLAKA